MRALACGLATLLLTTGCASKENGTWAFVVSDAEVASQPQIVEHNYTGGVVDDGPADTSGWTQTNVEQNSDGLMIGTIFDVEGEEYETLLVLGEHAYFGTTRDDGSLEFTWTQTTDDTTTDVHVSGYHFEIAMHDTEVTTITLSLDDADGTGSGTISVVRTFTSDYTESDLWDKGATFMPQGQIPFESWLADIGEERPTNLPERTDCDTDPCMLSTTTGYTTTQAVELFETSGDEATSTSGQPVGVPPSQAP